MIKILTYVVTVICVFSLGLFGTEKNQTENTVSIQLAKEENTAAEDEIETDFSQEIIEVPLEDKTEIPETNTMQEKIVTTQPTITTQANTQEKKTQETSSSKPKETKSNTQSNSNLQVQPKTQETVQPKEQEKVQTQPKVQTQTQTQVNTETPKQQTVQSQVSNNKESFKENTAIINEIRNIINSNPSTYMKQLGYNIVVDSSIVNLTTGFTYTQTRVKNAISCSFGTIRIYARDYYVGNELRWTEAFIL